MNQKTS